MARAPRIVCDSCGSTRIDAGAPLCGACGRPTIWATHQDRTDWEVRQWRKGRSSPGRETATAIVTLPAKAPQRSAVVRDEWNGFLTPNDPKPQVSREPRPPSAIVAFLERVLGVLRTIFGSSMMVPLGTKPAPAADPDAAAAEPVPDRTEPPRMTLVRAPEPGTAVPAPPEPAPAAPTPRAPAPISSPEGAPANGETPVRRTPAKPRKRPNPPTNKDMLKQTLSVLTKVEQRLEQLEQEVAGIDNAVRKVAPSEEADEPTAVGE